MSNKRSDLAKILRSLADYIDRHPDEELTEVFQQATTLMQSVRPQKKHVGRLPGKMDLPDVNALTIKLHQLQSRDDGINMLEREVSNRRGLEALARFLQLPVQRDDSTERLREKIIENTIGSRLRSTAIQG